MNRKILTELTNMCMIYANLGNVLVQEKIVNNSKGIIFPGGHIDSIIREIQEKNGISL